MLKRRFKNVNWPSKRLLRKRKGKKKKNWLKIPRRVVKNDKIRF